MKNLFKTFIFFITISTFIATPFSYAHAQSAEDVFKSYENIFKGGIQGGLEGLESCAADAVEGFLDSVAEQAVTTILSEISNLLSGEVPVGEEGVRKGQKELTKAAKETSVKEQCLDSIASGVAAQLQENLINQTLNWVNEFESGQPAFVTDIGQRMVDLAYGEYRDYLKTSSVLSSTCSLFRDEIIAIIDESVDFSGSSIYDPGSTPPFVPDPDAEVCLLDQITGGEDNTRAFLAGDFSKGGWDAWFAAFNDVGSNKQLALQSAANELVDKVAATQQEEMIKLSWNNGYISQTECPAGSTEDLTIGSEDDNTATACIDENGNKVKPRVTTPGSQIQRIAEEIVTSEVLRTALADELSEIFAAAGESLISSIFDQGLSNVHDVNTLGSGDLFDDIGSGGGPGGGIFTGGDPAGNLIELIDDQLEIERGRVDAGGNLISDGVLTNLLEIDGFFAEPQVTSLLNGLNQCSYVGNNPDAQSQVEEFASIPTQAANPDASGDDFESGAQKVDWAGNDFDWVEGRRYGLQDCNVSVYGGEDAIIRSDFTPRFSYHVARVEDDNGNFDFRWIISMCAPYVNSDNELQYVFPWRVEDEEGYYMPKAFREARNNVTFQDWTSSPMDWLRIDPYEGEMTNRYGFEFCDYTSEGEYSYHVRAYTKRVLDPEGEGDGAYKVAFIPQGDRGDDDTIWRRSVCRFNVALGHFWQVQPVSTFSNPSLVSIPTFSDLTVRIARTSTLIEELDTLKNKVNAYLQTAHTPEEEITFLQGKQGEFNALHGIYRFSDSRELNRLRGLAGGMESQYNELVDLNEQYCS